MTSFRYLISGPSDGPGNMALDEALFLSSIHKKPKTTFRVYSWKSPCMTIGYFQKQSLFASPKIPVIRRITGGLSVLHEHDVSYAFVTHDADWPELYDQEKTYQKIHQGICEALKMLGEPAEFYRKNDTVSQADIRKIPLKSLCVNIAFPYDIRIGTKKVVGSCQRRRGKVLLQQGSIHVGSKYSFEEVARALKNGWEKALDAKLEPSSVSKSETDLARLLVRQKYNCKEWNRKF